ncbi:MAG: gliding motility protein [Myxococcaceae bacterium]
MKKVLLVALLGAVACKRKPEDQPTGLHESRIDTQQVLRGEAGVGHVGVKVADGIGVDLRASPGGKYVTYLLEAEKPRITGVPPLMRIGELWSVATDGKAAARKLGNGVTNMPGGYLFSADGRYVLFLVGYNAAEQTGELRGVDLDDPKSEPERLGGRVSYMLPSKDGKKVAFIDEGSLKVGPLPKGPFRDVAADVSSAELSPDGSSLWFRRRITVGGGLYVTSVDEAKPPRRLADQVGDFKLTPDGKWVAYATRPSPASIGYDLYMADTANLKAKQVAPNVLSFRFSSDLKWLAYNVGPSPQDPRELFVVPLLGGEAKQIGSRVVDFIFSPDNKRMAFRDNYSENEGELTVAELPGGETKKLFKRARAYSFSDDGTEVAFTYHVLKPLPSVDLAVWRLGDEEATKVKQWTYDYEFTPDGKQLLFRSDCIREGRSCDLLLLDMTKPKEPPKKLVEAIHGFKLSDDGSRVLITYARAMGDFYDVAVFNLAKNDRKTLEQFIRLPPLFVQKDGGKVAYLVAEEGKSGVYLATDVP